MDVVLCQYFSCIYWDDHVFSFLILLIWWITLIDFQMLNKPCILGKTQLNHDVLPFLYNLIQFAGILLRIVASMFMRGYYSVFVLFVFSVLVMSLSSFVMIMNLIKQVGKCSHRLYFYNWYYFFLKYLHFETVLFFIIVNILHLVMTYYLLIDLIL